MDLTLDEASVKLGKTVRQVRYMIQQGRLTARKIKGRWLIDDAELALPDAQQAARDRKQAKLLDTVQDAVGVPRAASQRARYSAVAIKAVEVGLPLYRRARDERGAEDLGARQLAAMLELLICGAHRFDRVSKAAAYRDARDAASRAVCALLLEGGEPATALAVEIEQEVMPAIAGLLRRLDRKGR